MLQLREGAVKKNKLLVVNVHATRTRFEWWFEYDLIIISWFVLTLCYILVRAPLIDLLQTNIKQSDIDVGYNPHIQQTELYRKVATSKFVFCPSGLGLDTYRLWESLILGAIPIVESNPVGLDRTYGSLPVLVVENFAHVSEKLLHDAYSCFLQNARLYHFQHLSQGYWVDVIRRIQNTGCVDVYNLEHQAVNAYCNFMQNVSRVTLLWFPLGNVGICILELLPWSSSLVTWRVLVGSASVCHVHMNISAAARVLYNEDLMWRVTELLTGPLTSLACFCRWCWLIDRWGVREGSSSAYCWYQLMRSVSAISMGCVFPLKINDTVTALGCCGEGFTTVGV